MEDAHGSYIYINILYELPSSNGEGRTGMVGGDITMAHMLRQDVPFNYKAKLVFHGMRVAVFLFKTCHGGCIHVAWPLNSYHGGFIINFVWEPSLHLCMDQFMYLGVICITNSLIVLLLTCLMEFVT